MRILLSSICMVFFMGCASYPKKNDFQTIENIERETLNPYFSNTSKDYVYKAKIDAFDKSFGGIFIVKKLGLDHHRMVFTTEMGNTIFDFTIQGDDFKVNRILKEMDRKILLNILKRDFKTLTEEHPPVAETFNDRNDVVVEAEILSKKHYFYLADNKLNKIVRVRNGNETVVFLFSGNAPLQAEEIKILHKKIPLEMTLTALQ